MSLNQTKKALVRPRLLSVNQRGTLNVWKRIENEKENMLKIESQNKWFNLIRDWNYEWEGNIGNEFVERLIDTNKI